MHKIAVKYQAHVRFGSLADMCVAKTYVRFTPESDIKCDIWKCPLQKRTSRAVTGYSCELSNDEFRIGPRFSELDRPGEATGSIEPRLFTK